MKKYAWTWTIKPECVDEYVRMHKDPWPEMVKAHSDAGFHNYSIFQNGNQFFYVFETDDIDAARQGCADDESCQKWNKIAMEMIEGEFGERIESGIEYMEEVFFIE